MPAKLYILVRADLSPAQQAVQGMHAVECWNAYHKNNGICQCEQVPHTKVLLKVMPGEIEIWVRKISQKLGKGHYGIMYEPDLNNEMTAICCHSDKNIFSDLEMV